MNFEYKNIFEITLEKYVKLSLKQEELFLAKNPEDLLRWINIFEIALSRRLRNLSQALNVELLKQGLINSIVPLSILDAVITGQMSTQYSDSNLLKINLPTSSSPFGESIDLLCILIRVSELEFDNPRLRKCRSELREYHKLILKMVII